jgi:ketosteroid isomerase-like protein
MIRARFALSSALWIFTVQALFVALPLRAQSPTSAPEAAIRQVLVDQAAAWNGGDVVTFMHGYADSPRTTFIGKSVEHGYSMILARYQRNYASRDAMGQLDFSEIDVRLLGADDNPTHAIVTGRFHLARSQAGGGDASGIFSLVFEKESAGWKIILDHTSS